MEKFKLALLAITLCCSTAFASPAIRHINLPISQATITPDQSVEVPFTGLLQDVEYKVTCKLSVAGKTDGVAMRFEAWNVSSTEDYRLNNASIQNMQGALHEGQNTFDVRIYTGSDPSGSYPEGKLVVRNIDEWPVTLDSCSAEPYTS